MNQFLPNPFHHALSTEHASLAIGTPLALRYPADVAPFAGLPDATPQSLSALRDLLAPGESIYLTGDNFPTIASLEKVSELQGWQMLLPSQASPVNPPAAISEHLVEIQELTANDAPAMVALTDIAFPGYFRLRTYLMGRYYGIRINGALIAMAGGRLALPGYRELSAVCTHPDYTGRGYGARLINHVVAVHAAAGHRTFLHVGAANQRAIDLYERLGFIKTGAVLFNQFRRIAE
jgi:GNAT superfamily N-acetyltransferase